MSKKSGGVSKSKTSSGPKPNPTQKKTKRPDKAAPKKKRVYTDKELGITPLNSIVPAGVQKPKGAKKGKVFLDDAEGQMTMLNMVLAEREGNNESKMAKARQMEEIREARRAKMEEAENAGKAKLEKKKDEVRSESKRSKRSRSGDGDATEVTKPKSKKRVSFG